MWLLVEKSSLGRFCKYPGESSRCEVRDLQTESDSSGMTDYGLVYVSQKINGYF